MIDKHAVSGLREQWKVIPGTVSQAIGLEMVDTIETLMIERDAWKKREAELAAETNARAVFISRLQKSLGEMEDDRDLWKSKAERLAEALKEISGIEAASTEWDGYMVLRKARDTAKEALSGFEGKEK